MLRCLALVRTDVSEELSNTILLLLHSVCRLLVAACVVPCSPIFVTLMRKAPGSSETSVLTRAIRRNNPEDTILHSHRLENLKSYTTESLFEGIEYILYLVFLRSWLRLLVTANVPSSPILVTLMMKAIHSSEATVFIRGTCRNIPEDSILQCIFVYTRKSRLFPCG
jgi:hypothetical protein